MAGGAPANEGEECTWECEVEEAPAEQSPGTTIGALDEHLLSQIFDQLALKERCTVQAVDRSFRSVGRQHRWEVVDLTLGPRDVENRGKGFSGWLKLLLKSQPGALRELRVEVATPNSDFSLVLLCKHAWGTLADCPSLAWASGLRAVHLGDAMKSAVANLANLPVGLEELKLSILVRREDEWRRLALLCRLIRLRSLHARLILALPCVPGALPRFVLPALEELSLRFVRAERHHAYANATVDFGFARHSSRLRSISLQGTLEKRGEPVKVANMEALADCPALVQLRLHCMWGFDLWALRGCTALARLYISHCGHACFGFDVFSSMPSLRQVIYQYLDCLCLHNNVEAGMPDCGAVPARLSFRRCGVEAHASKFLKALTKRLPRSRCQLRLNPHNKEEVDKFLLLPAAWALKSTGS